MRQPACLALCLLLTFPALAPAQAVSENLAGLDIDELARIEITSVSRKAEPIANATAAVAVLTREDIRRSGASTLPDVLRLVPGLHVARVGARDWAVSARGFNQQSANKLLLLVDGRSVYSPIFAGVFWDALAFPIDEIERIEVIRGPGATLWGANAVQGVINIITRSAGESRGGRVAMGVGTRLNLFGSGRYGGRIGGTDVRVYAGGRDRDPSRLPNGDDAFDDWTFGQAGFRADGRLSDRDTWTVQGDVFAGRGGNRLILPTTTPPHTEIVLDDLDIDGVNLLGRWSRRVSDRSSLSVQAYYDRARREQTPLFGTMTVDQIDLQAQHRLPIGARHDVIWGAGFRRMTDEVTGAAEAMRFVPAQRSAELWTAFVQDDISLMQDRLGLVLGTKVEHNDYSGVEIQPNVRLLWRPATGHSVWAAVSRAVRSPSRLDADVSAVAPVVGSPVVARLDGSDAFDSERLIAYEAGYRLDPAVSLSLDFAAFYNDYDRLRTINPAGVLPPEGDDPRPLVVFDVANNAHGRAYGFEIAATWRASRHVRLRSSYSRLELRTALVEDAPPNSRPEAADGLDPEHGAELWLSFDLPAELELDVLGRYVGEIPGRGIPSYSTAGVRLGWRLADRFEVSLVGQDLLDSQHAEFPTITYLFDTREVGRRGQAKVVWRF